MRAVVGLAAVTSLSLTASGCVTVHGELAVVPTAQRSEAARALKVFTDAYNAADRAYDPELDAGQVTGALGAINQAGLRSRSVTDPDGNPRHVPLELTDAKFTIPKKAGWPRFFLADTDSNRDVDNGPQDNRWLLVFVRNGPDRAWEVAYLTIIATGAVPVFKTDGDGWGEAIRPDDKALAVAPNVLSDEYTSYLKTGEPAHFAPGPHTDGWRTERQKVARVPGFTQQYVDQPLKDGDFAPLGLATKDGGALVFFASRFFDRQTAAKGLRPRVSADVQALMTTTVTNTLTKEWMSNQAVTVPRTGSGAAQVDVIGRLQGVTGAVGS
ncbi:hypothetical protein HA039_24760 [Streptomyces liangshanensis]|uniref:DUF8094 domain-containing protein n=2 Tax=Streptomyces liangshanensis TaxID=2717324 RepID=A0A6G9H3E5_9ACTN|nr:hypothetical protein HA039_24760 [Streptomyces liangshanensis]